MCFAFCTAMFIYYSIVAVVVSGQPVLEGGGLTFLENKLQHKKCYSGQKWDLFGSNDDDCSPTTENPFFNTRLESLYHFFKGFDTSHKNLVNSTEDKWNKRALEFADSEYYQLMVYLLRRYRKEVRPVKDVSNTIEVGVYTYIYQLIQVDQRRNTIQLTACFEMYWRDEFLTWQPEDFGGISDMFLPSTDVWTPEISAYYEVATNRIIGNFNDLQLNHTGGIKYFMPFMVNNKCLIDVKKFPFDIQKCELHFGPWAYRKDELTFDILNAQADDVDFYDNQEWVMLRSEVKYSELNYTYLGKRVTYSSFKLIIFIERQSFYYIFNLVLPTAILAFVSIIGFHMPGNSSGTRDSKFRLGIMSILSMTMLLLAIVDDMPRFALTGDSDQQKGSSSSVPLIGIYYFSLLFITGCGTVTTSLFVVLERKVKLKQVPKCLVWLSWQPGRYKGYATPTGNCDYNVNSKVLDIVQDAKIFVNDIARRASSKQSRSMFNGPRTPRLTIDKKLTSTPGSVPPEILSLLLTIYNDIYESLSAIEQEVVGVRKELYSFMPKNSIQDQWITIINRLESTSLVVYLSTIFLVLIMFFYHDWY